MAWDREQERKAGKAMGIGSSLFGLVFAIFWCVMAAAGGAWFMLIFGIPIVGMMIFRLVMCIKYSYEEKKPAARETDPWERPAGRTEQTSGGMGNGYCPYCGAAVSREFAFCPHCGRKQR